MSEVEIETLVTRVKEFSGMADIVALSKIGHQRWE